jgi:excisionase family DNA binding protein
MINTARAAFWLGAHMAGRERQMAASEPAGRWMNVDQCAAYIGRTPNAVRMLVKKGQIPRMPVGRKLQFDREKIDRWMKRHAKRGAMLG